MYRLLCHFDKSEYSLILNCHSYSEPLVNTVKKISDMLLYHICAERKKIEANLYMKDRGGCYIDREEKELNHVVRIVVDTEGPRLSRLVKELAPETALGMEWRVWIEETVEKKDYDEIYVSQLRHITELLGSEFENRRFVEDLGYEKRYLLSRGIYTIGDYCRCQVWYGHGMLDGWYDPPCEMLREIECLFREKHIFERTKWLKLVATMYLYSPEEVLNAKLYEIDWHDCRALVPNRILKLTLIEGLQTVEDYLTSEQRGNIFWWEEESAYFGMWGIALPKTYKK